MSRQRRRPPGAPPSWAPALFVIPALALFGSFLLYPLATAVSYAFFEWKGLLRGGFVGLQNFAALATTHPYADEFPKALQHNLLFFLGTMIAQNSVGIFLAVQVHKRPRWKRVFQTLYGLPYLISPLVVGYLWSLLLSPNLGPVNALLKAAGLGHLALPWLGEPRLALGVVVLISAWQWMGFPVLLYGAALGGVPPELEEAASIDGAGGWRTFTDVTLPAIAGPVGTVTILTFIFCMEVFPLVYSIGGSTGSPAGALDVLALLFYRTSFQSGATNAVGMSSAIATVLFILILGTSLVANWLLRRMEARLT